MKKIVYPDYDKCILNYISSIRKYFNKEIYYKTNSDFDDILNEKDYKNIIIFLLDGLGVNILNKHLDENSFLKRNLFGENIAIYPSTTAASTTSTKNGLAPICTAWTGWENYFSEINRNLVLFTGVNYVTDEPTGFNTYKALPYNMFYDDLGVKGIVIEPDFSKKNYDIKKLLKRSLKACNDYQIQYVYYTEPDALLHRYGTDSNLVKETLELIDKEIENYFNKLPKDSLLIISADHGHIDVEPIDLYKDEEFLSMLKRRPSNDARCITFSVKDEYKSVFIDEFNKRYGDSYLIFESDGLIKKEFFGKINDPIHPRCKDFLADFTAVGIGNYYFNYKDKNDHLFKSHHAGITEEEMVVPVILIKK